MKRSRIVNRILSFTMAMAMVVTGITWPTVNASAADGIDESAYISAACSLSNSKASSDTSRTTDGEYDGYVTSISESSFTVSEADYIKIVYTIDDVSELTAESKLLTLQAYDTLWGGWADNFVYYTAADYDATTGKYTTYVEAAPVVASLTTGVALNGVNVSYCQADPTVQITSVSVLTEGDAEELRRKTEEAAVTITDNDGHETLQEFSMSDLAAADSNLTYAKCKSANVKVYIHVTEAGDYARLKVRGGNISTNSFSNKELVARYCTTKSASNSPYYIHLGYRTEAGYGSGVGEAGSGNYLFANTSVKKGADDDTAGIRLTRMTTDVDAYIIGIVFEGVGSVSISAPDEEGNVTITKGFDATAANVESQSLDDTDISDEEYEAEKAAQAAAVEAERQEWKTGLANAIETAQNLDSSNYTEDSWAANLTAITEALANANTVYADDTKTKAEYRAARDTLCDALAKLVPVCSTDSSSAESFRVLEKDEVIDEMGAGINLGNTFDGGLKDATETSWQGAKTTFEYIKALHDAGYNTVRIPVTWNGYINDDYSIDEAWIARIQEVVDYCISQDMYVIINVHHDGAANHDSRGDNPECWLNTAASDIDAVYKEYAGVWKTIAERFKDYDEHLIFESMNEVTDEHVLQSGNTNEDSQILMNLNQIFVNTVRATGSNNCQRWLALTGRFATTNGITSLPVDPYAALSSSTRLMFAVHIYKANSSTTWSYSDISSWWSSLSSTVKNVAALKDTDGNAIGSDVPIYVGEYGVRTQALSSSDTGYNNHERAENYEMCTAAASSYGVAAIVWDQGTGDYSGVTTETGLFTDWNRETCTPVYDDVVEATIRGTYCYSGTLANIEKSIYTSYGHTSTSDTTAVTAEKTVTAATTLTLSDSKVTVAQGEYKTVTATSDSDYDVILWSTDDNEIATVFNGQIHGKKAGVTTVHAYSQSGSVEKTITVVVPTTGEETCTAIKTDKTTYNLTREEQATIKTTLTPSTSQDKITYTSSNTAVATVSSKGVITAVAAGETYIVVSAASGVSTIVKVVVVAEEPYVNLSLHAYFTCGDQVGSSNVKVTGDGQYTLSFDCATDLDSTATAAGITALTDMTSIYIKDDNASKPVVSAAQIRYDKIVLNDTTELTITNTDFKSALKSGGTFDTNDPINGWDGSAVKEITTANHQVNFTSVSKPTKITVTFTLKDVTFNVSSAAENPTTSISTSEAEYQSVSEVGDTTTIRVKLDAGSDTKVTAFSADSTIAAVKSEALTPDANGYVDIVVTGASEGSTTIAVVTDNGYKLLFGITVGNATVKTIKDPIPSGLSTSKGTNSTTVVSAVKITKLANLTKGIKLTWSKNSKATGYVIYRRIGSGSYKKVKTITKNTTLCWSDKAANKNGTKYSYKVYAYHKVNGKVYYSKASAAKATYRLARPKLKAVSNVKGKKIYVKWGKNSKATGYQIKVVYGKKTVKTATITKKTTYKKVLSKLTKGKTYKVYIRTYKKVSGKKYYSAWSSYKKVKIRK